jgi:hypothetical protein
MPQGLIKAKRDLDVIIPNSLRALMAFASEGLKGAAQMVTIGEALLERLMYLINRSVEVSLSRDNYSYRIFGAMRVNMKI